MIPILFPADATTFASNGIGRLAECTRCEVTEERNGIYEMELDLPITAKHYPDIVEGMIISATHDDRRDRQPFIIYRRTAPINGLVTFYAHHISYLLTGVILRPYEAETVAEALALMPTYSMNSNPFTFWTDKDTRANFKLQTPTGCRQILGGMSGSILDVFGGGEYSFDNFTVRLYQKRGRDTDIEIRYGKNLVDLENDFDISGVAGGVVGWWKGGDDETVIHSPIVYADGYGNGSPVKSIDVSSKFEEVPTVQDVTAEVRKYIENNRPYEPNQTIKVDFVQLWQSPEYANVAILQRVFLCDTIKVIYPALGVNVRREVIKVKYDVLLDRYSEMELGTPRTTLIGMTEATMDEIVESIPIASRIAAAVEHATELITGGLGGHVVMNLNADGEPQEILIMDTDDIQTAVNVIRINKNGIGFSITGYEGPFTNAWTIDGHLVADFIDTGNLNAALITAGTMLADRILGGTLKIGGTGNTNGVITVYNAAGVQIGKWDNTGLSATGNLTISIPGYGPGYVIANAASFPITDNAGNLNNLTNQQTVYGLRVYSQGNRYNEAIYLIPATSIGINGRSRSGILSSGELAIGSQAAGSGANGSILLGANSGYFGYASSGGQGYWIELSASRFYVGYSESSGGNALLSAKGDLSNNSATATFYGYLTCTGGKSRLIKTKSYGERLQYCYEMSAPMFGDIGSGCIDEDGTTIIDIDDVFAETIRTKLEYQVFLQAEGRGDLWVSEKHENHFVVSGTPGLRFSWEIKAKQIDLYNNRLDDYYLREDELAGNADIYDAPVAALSGSMDEYIKEMEGLIYDVA